MNKNNQLVKQQSLAPILAKQERLLAIEEKILISFEERIIKNIALEFQDFFIKIISTYYPLSESLIDKYENKLIWNLSDKKNNFGLSKNYSIQWSVKSIEKYKDKWNWNTLSANSLIPWSIELIERYKDKWNWHVLSQNTNLPWTSNLIKQYKDKWIPNKLSRNESLPWSVELIELYRTDVKFNDSHTYVAYEWDWKYGLSSNKSLPWSTEFVKKYKDKWDWTRLMSGYSFPCKREWLIHCPTMDLMDASKAYKNSKYFVWTQKEIEEVWGWQDSSCRSLPWTMELIEKHEDSWNWFDLSKNRSLPWTLELIEKYEDKWYWRFLSANPSLPWSVELIEKYKDKWEDSQSEILGIQQEIRAIENQKEKWAWLGLSKKKQKLNELTRKIEEVKNDWHGKNWSGLSANPSLPWSIELIEKYKNKWSWYELSENPSLPWSIELIEKFAGMTGKDYLEKNPNTTLSIEFIENSHIGRGNWSWSKLSSNKFLPWSIDLIIKFQDKWDYKELFKNPSFPLSIGIIEQFKDKWDWDEFSNNDSIYEKAFRPYLTDKLIDEIMQKIIEKESVK